MSDPIQPEVRGVMNDIAALLDAVCKAHGNFGFSLLIFEFNKIEGGRMNYISNAQRPEMLAAMREFIAQNEGRAHQPPRRAQ